MYIEKIQQFISEYNPNINVRVGSPLYYLMIVPTAKIYEYIEALITTFKEYMLSKEVILSYYNIERNTGNYGTGSIEVTVEASQEAYTFPSGTIFTDADDNTLESTQDVYIINSISGTIPVQTTTKTNRVYLPGEEITCSIYGSLIKECKIKTQVSGGSSEETVSEWETRIKTAISQTTVTKNGIYNTFKLAYPAIIDVTFDSKPVVFNKATIYIKSPLSEKEVTFTESPGVLQDNLAKITYNSITIDSHTVSNKGLYNEINSFEFTGEELTIKYLSPYLVKDLQSYSNDEDTFPIGFKLSIKQAEPIFITGSITGVGNIETIKEYLNNHNIGSFKMSSFINNVGLTNYDLPIVLNFNGIEVNNTYIGYNAYYYDEITLNEPSI